LDRCVNFGHPNPRHPRDSYILTAEKWLTYDIQIIILDQRKSMLLSQLWTISWAETKETLTMLDFCLECQGCLLIMLLNMTTETRTKTIDGEHPLL